MFTFKYLHVYIIFIMYIYIYIYTYIYLKYYECLSFNSYERHFEKKHTKLVHIYYIYIYIYIIYIYIYISLKQLIRRNAIRINQTFLPRT